MLVRSTSRLIKEIGLVKNDLADNASQEDTLGGWYANLFFFQLYKLYKLGTATVFL